MKEREGKILKRLNHKHNTEIAQKREDALEKAPVPHRMQGYREGTHRAFNMLEHFKKGKQSFTPLLLS